MFSSQINIKGMIFLIVDVMLGQLKVKIFPRHDQSLVIIIYREI